MRITTVQDSHSRSSSRRNRRLAFVALVAFIGVLLLNGGAQAFWSAGGSGAGTGGSGTAVQAVTLTPGTTSGGLQPGGQRDVVLTVSNPNLAEVSVRSLAVDASQGTNGYSVDAGHSGCSVAALSFTTQTNGGAGWTVPQKIGAVNGTLSVTMPNALTLGTGAANACQGATFTVFVAAGP